MILSGGERVSAIVQSSMPRGERNFTIPLTWYGEAVENNIYFRTKKNKKCITFQ